MKSVPFLWRDEWLVGCGEIDSQHRDMVARAGALQTAIAAGEPPAELERHFAALLDCTTTHFTAEEGLMLASGYRQYPEHREEHRRLLAQLGLVRQSLHSNAVTAAELLATVLQAWTVPHILLADKRFALYLRQTGKR